MRKKVHLGHVNYVMHIIVVCCAGILIAAAINSHYGVPFSINTKNNSNADSSKLVLVNLNDGSNAQSEKGFVGVEYFVDYSDEVESNPDWSSNNSGKWWENAFNTEEAGWQEGELVVGYDTAQKINWITTAIDPFAGQSSPQVHSVMGRVTFTSPSTKEFSKVLLDYDYEGGLIVWLNGKMIFNNLTKMPENVEGYFNYENPSSVKDAKQRTSPSFTTADVTEYKSTIQKGTNTLTFWNTTGDVNVETLAAALKLTLIK